MGTKNVAFDKELQRMWNFINMRHKECLHFLSIGDKECDVRNVHFLSMGDKECDVRNV